MTSIQFSYNSYKKTNDNYERFICKNSVFISNLPENILIKDILYQKKFIGQYGHIKSMIFLNLQKKDEKNLIVQFDTINQAALCILSLNNLNICGKKIKIKYLQTNYCYYFLNNIECKINNCIYLHSKQINSYLYKQLNYNENIDSLNLAIKILNLTKGLYDKIYNKLIGENFYNLNLKFPKLTIKKLKKYLTLIENKNESNSNQNKIKEKNRISKINNIKLNNLIEKVCYNNYKSSDEKSTSSESSSSNNEINKSNRSISINFFNNLNHSRFNFADNNLNNENLIEIPIYISNLINDVLINQINGNINYNSNNYKNFNYCVNWRNFIENIKNNNN